MAAICKDAAALRWGRAKVVEVFEADLRSLAAFRIVLAVIVLVDLAVRAGNLSAHYTDEGVAPRALALAVLKRSQWSLNLMNGTAFFQALLFGIAALAALALLVGYRTRLMTVVVWVMVYSIQWRNPWLLNAGDALLRVLLFWAMFIPLGAYWSVDRARRTVSGRLSMRFLSLGVVGLFLQIAFLYLFAAVLKSGPEWREQGTAIYYALSLDDLTTPVGSYLYQFPTLLKVLTIGTLGLEAFGPFLLFFPVLTGPVRTGAAMAFMGLQLGILVTMDFGLLSWLSALCMVCFFPSWFWDEALPKLRAAFPKRFNIAQRLRPMAARLAHVHGLPLRARLSAWGSVGQPSLVGITASMAADANAIRPGGHAARASAPPRVETAARMGVEATRGQSSLGLNLLAAFFVLYVFGANLASVNAFTMPEPLRPVGHVFGINQGWRMFAPGPFKANMWYVIPGTLRDGRQIDLLLPVIHNDPHLFNEVSWEKPSNLADVFEDKSWRKYLTAMADKRANTERSYFARYICRMWNAAHAGAPSELMTLEIVRVIERTLPDYERGRPEREVLSEHSCG